MRKLLIYFTTALGLMLIPNLAAADAVSVPSLTTVTQGNSFSIDVNIAQASDVYDWQFDLIFNPSVLHLTNVAEGTFLSTGGSTSFFGGLTDNTSGSVTFVADTLIGPIPGVSSPGNLAILTFLAFGNGSSPLTIQNVILQDSTGTQLTSSTSNGSVIVQGGTVGIPEPSALLLLASAIGCCGFLALARRS